MIDIDRYISDFPSCLTQGMQKQPWEIIDSLDAVLLNQIRLLSKDYEIDNNIAVHKTAVVEPGAILKGTIIVSENCFIGANAYLRGPIYLGKGARIGPGSEIKQSVILDGSATAHFNFVGNSVVGKNINFEAGSICANHYNEREDKLIYVIHDSKTIATNTVKFGALVGDNSRIGANAVLSPGTILQKDSIVKRLELVEQIKD